MKKTRKVYCIRCGRTYLFSGDIKSAVCPTCGKKGTLYGVKMEVNEKQD
ncbi:MAG: hypothetical protein ACTSUQ_11250 [Candidatus Freyarchaeota archaeon]